MSQILTPSTQTMAAARCAMRYRFITFGVLLVACTLAACGSGSSSGSGAGGQGGGTAGSSGASGSGADTSAGNADEMPFEDPGADAPALDLPEDVTQLAESIVAATTLDEAIAATQTALNKGGLSTMRDGVVVSEGAAPSASAFVPTVLLADLALEARARRDTATLSGSELARMLGDFGWPVAEGKSPAQSFMDFLAAWTNDARQNPSDPMSFAILFIAANNQLQSPRANLSLSSQDLDLVRFSTLELELLSAAFDRVATPVASSPTLRDADPCLAFKKSLGVWDTVGDLALVKATAAFTELSVEGFGTAVKSVKVGTKIWKFMQYMRYGTLNLTIDSESPTRKPRKSAAVKIGEVTAHAGVDQKVYDDYQKWVTKEGQQTIGAIDNCLQSMGLPTKTDINDVAKDAANWRVSWSIEKGSGTEVLFAQGQDFKYSSRLENQLTKVSDTEAKNTVKFEILPQLSDLDKGTERKRHAVFSAQLRRGKAPGFDTAWGVGKTGVKAAAESTIGVALGVASTAVDIAGNWMLEVASPKRYVTQELIEIVPKGWVGTMVIREVGEGHDEYEGPGTLRVWSSWSGRVLYETTVTMGGSEKLSDSVVSNAEGIGLAVSKCTADYEAGSGADNTCEGCGTGPVSRQLIRTTAYSGRKIPLGEEGAIVVLSAFPEELYGAIKDQFPPEFQAKIGTWELFLIIPSCGPDTGLTSSFTTTVTFQNPNWVAVDDGPTIEQFPTDHAWFGPFPPYGEPQLLFSGPIEANKDPSVIRIAGVYPRTATIPGTSETVDTWLSVDINLRRVD